MMLFYAGGTETSPGAHKTLQPCARTLKGAGGASTLRLTSPHAPSVVPMFLMTLLNTVLRSCLSTPCSWYVCRVVSRRVPLPNCARPGTHTTLSIHSCPSGMQSLCAAGRSMPVPHLMPPYAPFTCRFIQWHATAQRMDLSLLSQGTQMG